MNRIKHPNDIQKYDMNNPKRGYEIILTNNTFDSKLNLVSLPSAYPDIDEVIAKKCLESLGFTTYTYKNFTNRELMNLADEASLWDHENCDCLFVVISTHGNDDCLIFSYNNLYYLERYVEKFAKIKSLAYKPKIFIVNACRGFNYDHGAFMETTVDAKSFTDKSNPYLATYLRDCLILYSSFEGYVSFRDNRKGSWLIRSFFDVLQKNAYENDIISIMNETTRNIAFDLQGNTTNKTSNFTKQMPTIFSTLTRKLQFQKNLVEPERIILPQHFQKITDQISRLYKMDHENRGMALIFNFENFDEKMLALIKNKQPNQGCNENVEENIANLNKTLKDYRFC